MSDKQPYKEDIKMLAEDLHYFYFFLRMLRHEGVKNMNLVLGIIGVIVMIYLFGTCLRGER